MDQVLVGPDAERRRTAETGRGLPDPAPILMDIAGLESLIAIARSEIRTDFGCRPAAESRPPRKTPSTSPNPVRRAERSRPKSGRGHRGCSLRRSPAPRSSRICPMGQDPVNDRLMQESVQPETFDHNVELLEVASSLENGGLAPEFVATGSAQTPDLILRISATRLIELDVKTPRALQLPAANQTLKLLEPKQVVHRALHGSRGQFSTSGILVIAGEIWLNGIDAYANAAAEILKTPLASGASVNAREHYRRLVGVLFVSTGYNVDGTDVRSASLARWVPSPRYAEEISLTLPSDFDGPFTISFKPSSRRTPQGHHGLRANLRLVPPFVKSVRRFEPRAGSLRRLPLAPVARRHSNFRRPLDRVGLGTSISRVSRASRPQRWALKARSWSIPELDG